MHAGSGLELGPARTNGEWRPELQAPAALAQEVTRGLRAQGVERAPLGIDGDLLAELARARGEDGLATRELREAQRLFTAIGAPRRAAEITAEITAESAAPSAQQ